VREIVKLSTVLMLYTLIAGALLAFVYIKTSPIIESNKMAASGDTVMKQVFPGMDGGFEKQGEKSEFPYWVGYMDAEKKKPGGYIFITRGKGYSSTIEIMVGVDIDGTITGVKIISQQETPGLGDRIEEIRTGEDSPWFTSQFVGKSLSDNLSLTKDDGIIDAISGATISSSAVTNSIKSGLNNLQAVLAGEEVVIEEPEEIIEEETKTAALIIPSNEDIAEVLPDMNGGYEVIGEESEFPYWIGYQDTGKKKPCGYTFVAHGKGFASTIQILVGTDADGTIIGIKTLSQEETPGYGGKIEEIREGENEPWFIRQFIGKSVSYNIALNENGGDIDAISGATITSTAVTKSINIGLNNLKDALAGKKFPKRTEPEKEKANEIEEENLMEQLINQTSVEKDTKEEEDIMSNLMRQADE